MAVLEMGIKVHAVGGGAALLGARGGLEKSRAADGVQENGRVRERVGPRRGLGGMMRSAHGRRGAGQNNTGGGRHDADVRFGH